MAVRSRVAAVFSGSRDLVRIAYRDPEHVSERLTLYASPRLGKPSRAWADDVRRARPDTPPAVVAEELRTQSAKIARIDGAIAGTPFYLAVVPGYLSYLWQEGRMALRIAALYGRDPEAPRTGAEVLALRGVHPTVDAAEAALTAVRDSPPPEKVSERRGLSTWIRSVRLVLVFGGFLAAPSNEKRRREGVGDWLRDAAALAIGGILWLVTWVFPLAFMIAMSWACESHARQLGRRAIVFYDGEAATVQAAIEVARARRDRGHDKRQVLRAIALALSIAIPIGFVAYVDHIRNTVGVNWLGAIGALVAVSVVAATAVVAARR
jgi:hypothetical protein